MTNTITLVEAPTILAQAIAKREFNDAIIIKDQEQPLAALISAKDYAFLIEAQRRERVREAVQREWERKFNSPEWREAIVTMDDFRNQFADVDDETLMADLDEAIAAVRKEAQLQPIR